MIVVRLLRRGQTAGGIVLPGNAADPQGYGEVLSVGPEVPTWKDQPEKNIKEGEKIVFHVRAGMDMIMEKEILRTLKYDEVYGILTSEEFIDNLEEMTLSAPKETPLIQTPGGGDVIVS